MTAAKAFHFASEFKVTTDGSIVQNTETVDDCDRTAGHGDNLIGSEVKIGLMADCEYYGVHTSQCLGKIFLNFHFLQSTLVPKEAGPGMARCGIGILLFQFPPVLHVRIVNNDITDVFPIRGAKNGNLGSSDYLAHIAEGITDQLCNVEGTGVVNVDGEGRDLEDIIIEAHEGMISPDTEAAVLGKAVAADAGAREDHVRVSGTDLDGLDDFD
jgi:hypothetical protein